MFHVEQNTGVPNWSEQGTRQLTTESTRKTGRTGPGGPHGPVSRPAESPSSKVHHAKLVEGIGYPSTHRVDLITWRLADHQDPVRGEERCRTLGGRAWWSERPGSNQCRLSA